MFLNPLRLKTHHFKQEGETTFNRAFIIFYYIICCMIPHLAEWELGYGHRHMQVFND